MDKTKNVLDSLLLIQIPQYGLILFTIINIVAIICYPGGTYWNESAPIYSFTNNFLSDLGRTMSHSKEINFISSQLFNISLIMAGCIFTFFYIKVIKVFNRMFSNIILKFGSFAGILGGVSIAGVGFTPADLFFDLHVFFAHWLFRFMLIASICYVPAIYFHPQLKNKYAYGYILFCMSILFYIIFSELGPSPKTSLFALQLQVVAQKIILFVFMFSIYIQTIGIQKLYQK
tara:strand:+ start:191 stop:883 length:693 start_codon:yes stop_codon:yes gene_type:complete